MREITIQDAIGILIKWLALFIIVPIVSASVTAAFYYLKVPDTYRASAEFIVLYIRDQNTGVIDLSTSTQYAQDYQQLITNKEVITKTAETLGYTTLGVSVNVSSSGTSSRIFTVNCSGTDPQRCADVANTIGNVFVEYLNDLMGFDAINMASSADVPTAPSGPNRFSAVLRAFAIALVACLALAFGIELLNTSIRTEADVTELLELPLLSSIEGYRVEFEKYRAADAKNSKSLYRTVTESTREDIKTLATNVQFCAKSKRINTLTITSTQPSEGKSSVAVMLATALAEEGKNVMIVDMDFRNPYIGKLLRRRNRSDLVDYMSGECELNDIICASSIEGVYFVDSFHRNTISANIARSEAFDRFIQDMSDIFDFVILDTAPIGLYIDAAVVSSKTDATLLIIGSGSISRNAAKDSIEQLSKANANLIGVALNFVKRSPTNGYYYYNYRRYQYKYYRKNGSGSRDRHSGERWASAPEVVESGKAK